MSDLNVYLLVECFNIICRIGKFCNMFINKYIEKLSQKVDRLQQYTEYDKMHQEVRKTQDDEQQREEQQIVLFKYKRAHHQLSFDEIKVQSKKIKANPESIQRAVQIFRKNHLIDRETMLNNLFQKLQLQQKQPQQKKQDVKAQVIGIKQQITGDYFLKKVQLSQTVLKQSQQLTKEHNAKQIHQNARSIRQIVRKQTHQQKFNKFRKITQNADVKRRKKYKIIDIKQQNMVDFNGQKFEYQDLLNQQGQESSLVKGMVYDYYVLRRGKATINGNQVRGDCPQVILPQEAEYLLDCSQKHCPMQQETPHDSEQDSNCEDRQDYDYPEEDRHQKDSDDSSEGVISGKNNDNSDYCEDDEDLCNSQKDQDQQEHYRQYLRRCKTKQQGDQQLNYLYNLKPSKYDSDSDD